MAGTTSGFMRPPVFDLQAHLFASLLQGHTADVSLVVRGSWEAVYMLHRVVLIQAVCLWLFLGTFMLNSSLGVLPLSLPELWLLRNPKKLSRQRRD
jgi:hypothetical protein